MAPPVNTAMSVVPPPMSIRHTPRSFSSSLSTDLADASGCRITSRTSRPQRRTHLVMFSTADTAPVTMWTLTSSRTPLMPMRLAHVLLAVDDEFLRQDVQHLLVVGDRDRLRGVHDAVDVELA